MDDFDAGNMDRVIAEAEVAIRQAREWLDQAAHARRKAEAEEAIREAREWLAAREAA